MYIISSHGWVFLKRSQHLKCWLCAGNKLASYVVPIACTFMALGWGALLYMNLRILGVSPLVFTCKCWLKACSVMENKSSLAHWLMRCYKQNLGIFHNRKIVIKWAMISPKRNTSCETWELCFTLSNNNSSKIHWCIIIIRGQQACKLCGAYCVYIYGFRMGRIAVHESPNIRS